MALVNKHNAAFAALASKKLYKPCMRHNVRSMYGIISVGRIMPRLRPSKWRREAIMRIIYGFTAAIIKM